MDWPADDFIGGKVGLFFGDKLIVYLRDDKPGLSFANLWDMPGGGREGKETPIECAIRETDEEFGIKLTEDSFIWQKEHPAMTDPTRKSYFFVAKVNQDDVDHISFGSEGQRWQLMTPREFLGREDVVPHLKERLQAYLSAQ